MTKNAMRDVNRVVESSRHGNECRDCGKGTSRVKWLQVIGDIVCFEAQTTCDCEIVFVSVNETSVSSLSPTHELEALLLLSWQRVCLGTPVTSATGQG